MQRLTIRRVAGASPPTSVRTIGQPSAGWRHTTIVAIKLLHSAIFLVNSASVLHICWIGVTGRRSRWTRPALIAALGETSVFVANRGRCPLTGLAERLGAESGRVSTIFLPQWFADRIPLIFGPPLGIGLLLLAWRSRSAPPPARAEQIADRCPDWKSTLMPRRPSVRTAARALSLGSLAFGASFSGSTRYPGGAARHDRSRGARRSRGPD